MLSWMGVALLRMMELFPSVRSSRGERSRSGRVQTWVEILLSACLMESYLEETGCLSKLVCESMLGM